MTRSTKIAGAGAGAAAAVAALLVFGAAAPANAAPGGPPPAGSTLEGPVKLIGGGHEADAEHIPLGFYTPTAGGDVSVRSTGTESATMPGLNATGPIQIGNYCVTRTVTPIDKRRVQWQTCNGGAQQQWTLQQVTLPNADNNAYPYRFMVPGETNWGLGLQRTVGVYNNGQLMTQTIDFVVGSPGGAGTEMVGVYSWDGVTGDAADVVDVVIGSPADGSTVTTATPTVSGTGEPGATVTVTDGAGNTLGTATVDANGNWSVPVTSPLPEGPNTVTATQDANGETSTATSSFTVAAEGPAVPLVDPLLAGGLGVAGLALAGAGFLSRRKTAAE